MNLPRETRICMSEMSSNLFFGTIQYVQMMTCKCICPTITGGKSKSDARMDKPRFMVEKINGKWIVVNMESLFKWCWSGVWGQLEEVFSSI